MFSDTQIIAYSEITTHPGLNVYHMFTYDKRIIFICHFLLFTLINAIMH